MLALAPVIPDNHDTKNPSMRSGLTVCDCSVILCYVMYTLEYLKCSFQNVRNTQYEEMNSLVQLCFIKMYALVNLIVRCKV